MRIHLLALPNVQTTAAYHLDGFATATRRFARVLKELGHTVLLYGSEENDAPCDELIPCITKEEQELLLAGTEYQATTFKPDNPLWMLFNPRAAKAIGERKQSRDMICSLGGASQAMVTDAHPDLLAVEYNIGYVGNYAQCRVFQSKAWQHWCYGNQNIQETRFFDAVIPAFFDPADFPAPPQPREDLYVYVGRYIERKGLKIIAQACAKAGKQVVYVGHGTETNLLTGQNLGPLPDDQRNALMARAQAVLCPTTYIEPFNCVAVEAQLCGTPVIATDFGGFLETVEHGKTGYRCNTLGEFVQALDLVQDLDRDYIRQRAIDLYSLDAAKRAFTDYFDRINLLWDDGWNSMKATL